MLMNIGHPTLIDFRPHHRFFQLFRRTINLTSGSEQKLRQLIKTLEKNPEDILTILNLGEIGDLRAINPLTKILEGDHRDDTREFATYALGRIGDPGANEVLGSVARDENEPYVIRETAVRALGKIADPQAIKLLIRIYQENEFDKLGDSAATILRELGVHSYYGLQDSGDETDQ
jgi:HEAT repeat protein